MCIYIYIFISKVLGGQKNKWCNLLHGTKSTASQIPNTSTARNNTINHAVSWSTWIGLWNTSSTPLKEKESKQTKKRTYPTTPFIKKNKSWSFITQKLLVHIFIYIYIPVGFNTSGSLIGWSMVTSQQGEGEGWTRPTEALHLQSKITSEGNPWLQVLALLVFQAGRGIVSGWRLASPSFPLGKPKKIYIKPLKNSRMTMENSNHEWRCISYLKWWCSNVMLVFRGGSLGIVPLPRIPDRQMKVYKNPLLNMQ